MLEQDDYLRRIATSGLRLGRSTEQRPRSAPAAGAETLPGWSAPAAKPQVGPVPRTSKAGLTL